MKPTKKEELVLIENAAEMKLRLAQEEYGYEANRGYRLRLYLEKLRKGNPVVLEYNKSILNNFEIDKK